ncbi:MAG: type VI secretion system tip protein TssI/VgrG [Anderseniella sp.]|jgi:type VI secretion system secreted protein VgrG|nr:type VI secretion system tip protein TssI/VgrG [Anderseniella sp.]
MPSIQRHRSISVNTVLGEDVLLLRSMNASERLSAPFEYELTLLSDRVDVPADDLLGTPATVALELPDGQRRFFNGYISRFSQTGFHGSYTRYKATLVPWLWFLSRTADCRTYQDKKVPDIVKEIFREHGFTDFDERLSGTYRNRTYCVQYRETDLDFIDRLLENEGIYYFFEHVDGKHTLVLADSYSAHSKVPGYESVPYFPQGASALREIDHIDDWTLDKEVRPGAFAHNAYDFTAPRKNLLARRSAPKGHAMAEMEVFDFQGDYTETADGEGYARTRLEEVQANHEIARAAGNARGLACGVLFSLTGYQREDQNREYLIIATTYSLQSDEFKTGAVAEEPLFRSTLGAIDAQVPYRPPSLTTKPVVKGPQTAIVVGKAGEEVWTDKYGRIKIQFHWDRYGKSDETSSCWVRVAQVWAGKGWGGMMIPRIGQEVIVDFLEGDPDQPIVTGRVYNGDCMPPYTLPGEGTKTALKTCSSKGGGGFNEIRFEDKKGSEQVFIHAEKNQDVRIKNDTFEWVGNEQHLIVKSDQLEEVGGDKHLAVKGDRNEKVSGTVSLDAGVDLQQKVGMKHGLDAGMEIHLKAGMNVVIEAGMSITLKAGGGFVVVGPSGVTISGTPVLINSGGTAGSGSGCSPDAPKAPTEADEAEAGKVSDAQARTPPASKPAPAKQVKAIANAQAQSLMAAAETGVPFCEKCEAARRAQAAQSGA